MTVKELDRRLSKLEARKVPELPKIIIVGIARNEHGEWAEACRFELKAPEARHAND